jgi:hypothetical protein
MATKVINSLTFGDTYVFTTPYATSSTGASTQAKAATLTPNSNFSLETGVRVAVKFSAENTASSPTLNVNSSGAKTIQFRGAALTSSLYRWAANSVVEFMYDGTYWQMLGAPNNTDTDTNTNYYHTRVYSSGLKISTGTGVSDMYVPTGTTSALGVVKQHTADDCTSYTSDEGATTPAAVKKAVGMFVTVTPSLTSGTKVGTITVNGTDHELYCQTNTDTNTHYTTKLFATSSTGTAHAATTNGNTYLRLFDDSTARQSIKITGSGATSVTSDANGVITISSTDNNTNTYGRSGNTASKIYLMGTLEQSTSNKTSYSNVSCYASGGYLYSNGKKVSVEGHTHTFTDTNTSHTHAAGDGISLTGSGGTSGTTTIALAESGVTAGACGPAAGEELFHSQSFYVPQLSVDKYGRVTQMDTVTYTLPSSGNTDTKVTQAAAITATTSASYPVMLGYSSTTSAVTNTVNKSAKLTFNTGTGELIVGTGSTAASGKLTVDGDIIAGGGSDNYGIHPKKTNYSTLGKANQYWYKVYSANIYTNSIKKLDGTAYSFPATITWNEF